jgi:uncharacterized protein YpmS
MKHLKLFLIALTLIFVSCMKGFDTSYNEQQQIKDNVENVFGVTFPSTQDWSTTINSSIKIYKTKKIH